MMKTFLLILALICTIKSSAEEPINIPILTSPVMDTAHLLDPDSKNQLENNLRKLWSKHGSQVAILTMNTLNGLPIEQARINIVDQWKLGTGEKDNGILFLIVKEDRTVRIEVGQGLEGQLTDAHCRRIIDRIVLPYFRQGDYRSGIIAGITSILQHTDPNFELQEESTLRKPKKKSKNHLLLILLLFLFFIFRNFFGGGSGGGYSGRYRRHRYSSWGGNSGGGFSGGFSGGGGGFSGGGASGKW